MANTTFQGNVRAEGGLEQVTKSATTGAYTTNFDVDTSGSMIYRNRSVSIDTATYDVEATQSGTVFTLNRAAGIVVTLPVATAGLNYKFIVGTTFTGAGQILSGSGTQFYTGFARLFDPAGAGDTNAFASTNTTTIDLGSAAQGWLIGGIIRLVALPTYQSAVTIPWHCDASLHGDGTLVTPFE